MLVKDMHVFQVWLRCWHQLQKEYQQSRQVVNVIARTIGPTTDRFTVEAIQEKFRTVYNGLYGSKSCCISQCCQVNGRGRFSTLHSSKTPRQIFMKFEIYNYFQNSTLHAKFQGSMSTWVVWGNSQFDAWKFLSFFLSSSRPQVASLDIIMRRSQQML